MLKMINTTNARITVPIFSANASRARFFNSFVGVMKNSSSITNLRCHNLYNAAGFAGFLSSADKIIRFAICLIQFCQSARLNASCTAFMARTPSFSLISTVTRISEVEIILIFTPSL